MANKKHNPLAARLHRQKAEQAQPSILQDEEKKWNWHQILISVLLIYAGVSFMHGCYTIIDLKSQQNAIVAQTRVAEAQKKDLENEVSYMQTQEAVEKTAREELNMVKPGEILLTQRVNNDDEEDAEAADGGENAQAADDAAAADGTAAAGAETTTDNGVDTSGENGETAQ